MTIVDKRGDQMGNEHTFFDTIPPMSTRSDVDRHC